ncbi:hypothetical protein PJL18_04345 [Paenarthrobacter nicotinovorans]|nr:hypothetical protein [Paenarthrobacter nicotinovorans]
MVHHFTKGGGGIPESRTVGVVARSGGRHFDGTRLPGNVLALGEDGSLVTLDIGKREP